MATIYQTGVSVDYEGDFDCKYYTQRDLAQEEYDSLVREQEEADSDFYKPFLREIQTTEACDYCGKRTVFINTHASGSQVCADCEEEMYPEPSEMDEWADYDPYC